ncbi:MAG TPA: hypothetical protein VJ787_06760 [Thermoleophilia bacterium]|nr:hypothetical protein [Thermoleophilia bacterium]
MKRKHWLLSIIVLGIFALGLAGGTTNLAGWIIIEDAAGSPPTCATATVAGELCVEGDIESNGALDIAGATTLTGFTTAAGGLGVPALSVTGVKSLALADCGKTVYVSAGIDTATITLPEASAATAVGCAYTISYIGADGGALLDISPLDTDADGIEGGCTLAASVVYFSGTADADIGLTKTTGLTGDFIRLAACGAAMWCVTGCQGIWANN